MAFREKRLGVAKPIYLGRYRDPETHAPGTEIWLPWPDPVVIVGLNRVGKDTGIIIPNVLKRDRKRRKQRASIV